MNQRLKIAILGDFPISKVNNRFAAKKCFYAGWLYNLFELLEDVDDFEIHWIVADKEVDKDEEFLVGKQTFHLLSCTGLTVGLYTAYIYNRIKVARCIRKISPDIFHAWGTERFYGLAAKDFHGTSILSVQGLLTACGQRAPISPFERKQRWYEKGVLKAVDFITTESSWARDRVLEIAPNAKVTLWEYAPESWVFELSRNLTANPTCLCAGTHTAVKDIPTVIEAFSSPQLAHVTLYLAGVAPGEINPLPTNVVPLGNISRNEMAKYLSKVWCLAHPSLADSSPNIVKEARVVGIPAVVTKECGGKQYIEHGKSGFIISPGDVNAMINAVIKMTTSADTALQMGFFNRDICRNQLSLETMKTGVINLYNKALKK